MRVWVDVDVDVADVFEQLGDEALLKELERRGHAKVQKVFDAEESELAAVLVHTEEALDQLRQGRADDARLTLERALYPKWKSVEASAAEFIRMSQVAA